MYPEGGTSLARISLAPSLHRRCGGGSRLKVKLDDWAFLQVVVSLSIVAIRC